MAIKGKYNPIRVKSTSELRDILRNRKISDTVWDKTKTWVSEHDILYNNKAVSPNVISKWAGEISNTIVEVTSAEILTSPLNKGWRAAIAIRKAGGNHKFSAKVNGQDSDNKKADQLNYHIVVKNSETNEKKANKKPSLAQQKDNWFILSNKKIEEESQGIAPQPREVPDIMRNNVINNRVMIVNFNTSPATYLELQHRPPEIEVKPTSNWIAVKSMGRNNPFYMYTGGDDSLTIEVVWFMDNGENREDVITKCRLLESWSKANGYSQAPPVLGILWGASDLFKDDTFILESAPYTLKNFQNGRRPTPSFKELRDSMSAEAEVNKLNKMVNNIYRTQNFNESFKDLSSYKNYGLLPGYAIQHLTFKRVTPYNRTYPEIVSEQMVKKVIHGIKEPSIEQPTYQFVDSGVTYDGLPLA